MNDGLKDRHRKKIIEIFSANERVKQVVLFGSRAMETHTPASDVDLALFGDDLTMTDQAKLAAYIEELPMPQRVDLLRYKSIKNRELLAHIQKYGVEWYRRSGDLSADWPMHKVAKLEQRKLLLVQDGNHGEYRPRKTEFAPHGVAFIRAADLGKGTVQFDTAEKINEAAFHRIRKGIGANLDTILSTKGTVGKLSFVPDPSPQFVCSPQTSFWRSLNHDFIIPKFLYYELQSQHFLNQIRSRKGETDMADYLSLTSQRGLHIRVPDIDIQIQIIEILEPIDGKIQLNCRINHTLEEMAQAIFKSWFVDFDPVKAKIKAKQNGQSPERVAMCAISGKTDDELDQIPPDQLEQLAATAALFPDELVDSDVGLIPKGWATRSLYGTADFINGAAFKSKDFSQTKAGFPIVKIAELKSGITAQTKFTEGDYPERYIIDNDEILYSWSGSPNTSLEVFKWFGGKGWLNQHIFKVVTNSDAEKYVVFYLLRQLKPTLIAIATDKQTTGLGHVTVADMKRLIIPYPNKEFLSYFGRLVGPIFDKASNTEKESKYLAQLRDTLLPKLLVGKINLVETRDAAEAKDASN